MMSVDLALNSDHDLNFSATGDVQLTDGAERIAQQIKITLLAVLGEWFLDISFGVPYLEAVLVKSQSRSALEAIFRARIAAVPGVRAVRSIEFFIGRQHRTMDVQFSADTEHGLIARRLQLPVQRSG